MRALKIMNCVLIQIRLNEKELKQYRSFLFKQRTNWKLESRQLDKVLRHSSPLPLGWAPVFVVQGGCWNSSHLLSIPDSRLKEGIEETCSPSFGDLPQFPCNKSA